jgi:drug/metabolite transporter (DMT)-like permease
VKEILMSSVTERGDAGPRREVGLRSGLANPYLLLTLAAFFWGGNVVVGRLLGAEGVHRIPPATLTALRWGIALVVLAPLALPELRERWGVVRAKAPWLAALGVISIAGYYLPFYAAMRTVPALDGGLIVGAGPAVILALAVLARQERLDGWRSLGVLAAIVGAAYAMTHGDLTRISRIALTAGHAMIAFSVLCWGVYTVLLRRWKIDLPPLALLCALVALGLAATLPLAAWEIASEPRPADLSAQTILAVLYIGLFPAVGSTLCWNTAVARVGAGAAGVFMTLIPIFATALAVPALGERLEPYHLIALALVVGGVGLAALRGARSLRQGG